MTMPGDDEGCIHLIYPPTSCTICHPKQQADFFSKTVEGHTTLALYDGQCSECDLPIRADEDWIIKRGHKWIHRSCG